MRKSVFSILQTLVGPYSKPLLSLRRMLYAGVHPKKLKMAKTIPIFKTDDNTDANNYRPISLLSNFDRTFEKLIFNRMESFIEKNNLFYPSQYGFRKAHSTQHASLGIVNTIQTNMDKRLFSCGVFRPEKSF